MRKKEYIEKLANLIVNRVKYQAPRLDKNNIDYAILDAINIDQKYPIFIYKKRLDKIFFQAFLRAKERCEFNLILTEIPIVSKNSLKRINKTYLIMRDEIGSLLQTTLDALNINYHSGSNFKKQKLNEYIKINDKEQILDFLPFYKGKKYVDGGVICDIKSFLLNGKNYVLELTNTKNTVNEINVEINIPLPQGYYFFKKNFDNIEITNLTTKQRAFFNFFVKNVTWEYSCIESLQSCTYACINMKTCIEIKPQQKKFLFFNMGDEKFVLLSQKEIQDFFAKSQEMMCNTFDVKITTKNAALDARFNRELPMRIWQAWNDFGYDEDAENEWLKIKNQVVLYKDQGIGICEDYHKLKEVSIYKNSSWKRVFIVHNNACYLFAGGKKYYNYNMLTKELFDKNNEIYLSFA